MGGGTKVVLSLEIMQNIQLGLLRYGGLMENINKVVLEGIINVSLGNDIKRVWEELLTDWSILQNFK